MDVEFNMLERSVIGTIILNNGDIPEILVEEDFTVEPCRLIFKVAKKSRTFDAVEAVKALIDSGLNEELSQNFIKQCIDDASYEPFTQTRFQQLHEIGNNRRLRNKINKALLIFNGLELAGKLSGICQEYLVSNEGDRLTSIADAAAQYLKNIENENTDVLYSGFSNLDQKTKGMRPGNLIIIAARPSVGKSAFLLNIALNVAAKGNAIMIFNLEMSNREVVQRSLSNYSNISLNELLGKKIDTDMLSRMIDPLAELSRLPVILSDSPALNVSKMEARIRQYPDTKLVIVDYAGLMQTSKAENRNQELSLLTRELKMLAIELRIPIIVAQQLNRGINETERPKLTNIRDSGSFEQDGDKILLMWKKEDQIVVEVAKNRQGETGSVIFDFDGKHMRFKESNKMIDDIDVEDYSKDKLCWEQ